MGFLDKLFGSNGSDMLNKIKDAANSVAKEAENAINSAVNAASSSAVPFPALRMLGGAEISSSGIRHLSGMINLVGSTGELCDHHVIKILRNHACLNSVCKLRVIPVNYGLP